ncbi:hypothetical protein M422DRAFT_271475 [Sphaerobolus stellatus SS14]|uniref:Uncharacterized protein n=1 Tax=Sphaerobolus stellatus (strain SS14) TaxID=990650 RepID=A0A0C9UPG0_SPHS4|nr:hypothetical protein M422DRAFT_271475 [Sphaerobolus stellatus SS14]
MPATDDSASEHSGNQRNSAHRTMGMSIRPMTGTCVFDAIAELTKNPSAEREQNEEPELVEGSVPLSATILPPLSPLRPICPSARGVPASSSPPSRPSSPSSRAASSTRSVSTPSCKTTMTSKLTRLQCPTAAVKPPAVASTGPGAKPSPEAPANPHCRSRRDRRAPAP